MEQGHLRVTTKSRRRNFFLCALYLQIRNRENKLLPSSYPPNGLPFVAKSFRPRKCGLVCGFFPNIFVSTCWVFPNLVFPTNSKLIFSGGDKKKPVRMCPRQQVQTTGTRSVVSPLLCSLHVGVCVWVDSDHISIFIFYTNIPVLEQWRRVLLFVNKFQKQHSGVLLRVTHSNRRIWIRSPQARETNPKDHK